MKLKPIPSKQMPYRDRRERHEALRAYLDYRPATEQKEKAAKNDTEQQTASTPKEAA